LETGSVQVRHPCAVFSCKQDAVRLVALAIVVTALALECSVMRAADIQVN
jgi:hypothetical protein